ncbi:MULTISPECIES: hemerythrin domain-containing protein [unclassified Fusibacter]|uniref:hemerythrin domain-containing protein n=1 Tax=unclassified Fusibacter TaxID=2624464 RepID=UPI00101191AB|nr:MULTISPECIES: hemerythrin domain-containing protein [unclassified Fusibacter]MCK8058230.1 response regulator [Fusibacter sp. A2]NPE20813.1 response regulator [Fusibacter sp. A1]RXV63017.1 response regulator [Fusibacter sp. A1]
MKKITIIESTDFIRLKLKKILNDYGYMNLEMHDSIIVKRVDFMFKQSELIILDLDNYDLDVIELVKELKTNKSTMGIPIILLSGQSDIGILSQAIKAGCTDFVTKPFSAGQIFDKVNGLIGRDIQKSDIESSTYFDGAKEAVEANLQWAEDYKIGIKEIDKEHKEIIDSFGKLYELMKNGQGHEYYHELTTFLEGYVMMHFANEEAIQKKILFDQHDEHVLYHRLFRDRVDDIISSNKNRKITDYDLIKINLFVKDWILHHILVEDKKIGEFLTREGEKINIEAKQGDA